MAFPSRIVHRPVRNVEPVRRGVRALQQRAQVSSSIVACGESFATCLPGQADPAPPPRDDIAPAQIHGDLDPVRSAQVARLDATFPSDTADNSVFFRERHALKNRVCCAATKRVGFESNRGERTGDPPFSSPRPRDTCGKLNRQDDVSHLRCRAAPANMALPFQASSPKLGAGLRRFGPLSLARKGSRGERHHHRLRPRRCRCPLGEATIAGWRITSPHWETGPPSQVSAAYWKDVTHRRRRAHSPRNLTDPGHHA